MSKNGLTLAVCMIVKNEQEALPICLGSVMGEVEEIVVCDTGSDDGTVEKAKELVGDESVFIHPRSEEWIADPTAFDFSAARNYALEQVKSDWVLSLDADEEVPKEAWPKMREAIAKCPEHIDLLMPKLQMLRDDGSEQHTFMAERLFRRGVRFRAAMHNWVDVPSDKRLPEPGIILTHNRKYRAAEDRMERDKQRHLMAERHFRKAIEENPEDTRSRFYLAGDLRDQGKHEEAVQIFMDYLNRATWKHERYQAAVLCARSLRALGRDGDAKQVLVMALADNWYRAEDYILLGDIATDAGDLDEAKHWFAVAESRPKPDDPMFIEASAYSWEPKFGQAVIAEAEGDLDEAHRLAKEAREKGAPSEIVSRITDFQLKPPHDGQPRMAVFIDRGQANFVAPLLEAWKKDWDVRTTSEQKYITELLEWADVAFFEWAGPLLIRATADPKGCRMVVRVHGYETKAGYLPAVDWGKVDDVIFVANYLGMQALEQAPDLAHCRRFMVPGGINVEKFEIEETKKGGHKIAMAGYLNAKKNLGLALQILAAAREKEGLPFELHVAGPWQDYQQEFYIGRLIAELGLKDCVFFHPWQEDLNAFYADKDFILSSSVEESLHYALAEGMAAGLKPVIHCWESSRDFYPEHWIFRTVAEAVEMLHKPRTPQLYRNWVIDHLSFERNLRRINRILVRPKMALVGKSDESWRIESKLAGALRDNGVTLVAPNRAQAVLVTNSGFLKQLETVDLNGTQRILWHAEQVLGDDERAQKRREEVKAAVDWADKTFYSNPAAKNEYEQLGAKELTPLYLGGMDGMFHPIRDVERDVEVGFVGVINERRKTLIDRLVAAGVAVKVLQSYDHAEVNRFYNRCKIALNLHISEEPNVETRMAEALSAGCLVATEPLPEGHPFDSDLFVTFREIEEVAELLKDVDAHEGRRSKAAWWMARNLRLDQQVEKLLDNAGI